MSVSPMPMSGVMRIFSIKVKKYYEPVSRCMNIPLHDIFSKFK
jgi:hypothetical protein